MKTIEIVFTNEELQQIDIIIKSIDSVPDSYGNIKSKMAITQKIIKAKTNSPNDQIELNFNLNECIYMNMLMDYLSKENKIINSIVPLYEKIKSL